MALMMKNGKEIRVPGRAIVNSKREGILGFIDAIPLSAYRKLADSKKAELMVYAYNAKKKFEKAAEYDYKSISGGNQLEGMRNTTVKCACIELLEIEKFHTNSPRYIMDYVKRPGPLDDPYVLSMHVTKDKKLPYLHMIISVAVSKSQNTGMFIIREQIDAFVDGRDFRWSVRIVDKTGKSREVYTDRAWELHRFIDIQIAKVKQDSFVLRMADGQFLEVG